MRHCTSECAAAVVQIPSSGSRQGWLIVTSGSFFIGTCNSAAGTGSSLQLYLPDARMCQQRYDRTKRFSPSHFRAQEATQHLDEDGRDAFGLGRFGPCSNVSHPRVERCYEHDLQAAEGTENLVFCAEDAPENSCLQWSGSGWWTVSRRW